MYIRELTLKTYILIACLTHHRDMFLSFSFSLHAVVSHAIWFRGSVWHARLRTYSDKGASIVNWRF